VNSAITLCRKPDQEGVVSLYGTRFKIHSKLNTPSVWIVLEVGCEIRIIDEKQNLLTFTQIGKKETTNGQN